MHPMRGRVNINVDVVAKTSTGKTDRGNIKNVITQEDVFGPLNQVFTFGEECKEEHKYIYIHKGKMEFPPLSMVDNLLCRSECGHKCTS